MGISGNISRAKIGRRNKLQRNEWLGYDLLENDKLNIDNWDIQESEKPKNGKPALWSMKWWNT